MIERRKIVHHMPWLRDARYDTSCGMADAENASERAENVTCKRCLAALRKLDRRAWKADLRPW